MELTLTQWSALGLGLLLLAQGARDGYRRGPVRQLAAWVALAVAVAAGWLLGAQLGPWLLDHTAVPWMLRGWAGAIATGTLAWLASLAWLWHLGRRAAGAEEPEHPVLGAVVGCWTGMLHAATLLLAICAWAGLDEAARAPSIARATWAVTTREHLAELPGLSWMHGYSPWPRQWVRLAQKGRKVLASPAASRRLMEQQPIRALASHPAFYTAWGDPEIKRLLREGAFWEAAHHPKARPLMDDENFQRQLLDLDLEVILDKSLIEKDPG